MTGNKNRIKIGNKALSNEDPCFISLEAGGTWKTFENAIEMIEAAASAGADGVKFQTFLPGDSERMMAKNDIQVEFTTSSGKKKEFVLDALRRRELTSDKWDQLVKHSHKLGLSFITTAVFPETVDLLKKIRVDAIKIAKGDINNVVLIDYVSKTGLPVILDGREKFEDVEHGIQICKKNNNEKIIIMHCPSGYPVENAGVHLSVIKTIKNKLDYPVGFADHSPNDIMNYAALALGVNMLEKTITSDKKTESVEHFMSLELNELKSFVENVRAVEQAMGDENILFKSRVSEDTRRSLVAKVDIKKGQKINFSDLDYQRPGNMGISVSDGFNVLDQIAILDIPKGTFLQKKMLKRN